MARPEVNAGDNFAVAQILILVLNVKAVVYLSVRLHFLESGLCHLAHDPHWMASQRGCAYLRFQGAHALDWTEASLALGDEHGAGVV